MNQANDSPLLSSHITERDLDLLLAEELHSSPAFRTWLQHLLSIETTSPRPLCLRNLVLHDSPIVQHSVSREGGLGETDVEALWKATWNEGGQERTGRMLLLVENKVYAHFQQDQADRYHRTGASRLTKGDACVYISILFAPREYIAACGEQVRFDLVLPYEALVEYFEARLEESGIPVELRNRIKFKLGLIRQGIDKSRRGYQVILDPGVHRLWEAYYDLAREEAPSLLMRRPSPKPGRSSFVHFGVDIGRGLHLCHKLEKGRVDLQIARGEKLQNEIIRIFSPLRPREAEFRVLKARRRPRSMAVSYPVPVIPNDSSPTPEIIQRIRQGLRAALLLQTWAHEHAAALEQITNRLA